MMTLHLRRPDLLRDKCYLNGRWVGGGEVTEVLNPATGEVVGTVPVLGTAELKQVIDDANAAWGGWAALTGKERAAVLRRWYELMVEHQEDLARIMTAEQGKPLAEAMGEIVYAWNFMEWFAEEAKRVYGDVIPAHQRGMHIVVLKQPVGVVAAITPWNFPSAMITRKAAPALAAGCPFIVKPSEYTPLSALALAVLAEEAGVPPGIFNVITGDAHEIGLEMTKNPVVRKVGFTGSTRVGALLMEQSASTVKKVSLELGGNAPFIVFDDADLEAAVAGAMACKFRNTGQTCVCANRIYVHSSIYEEFTQRFTEKVKELKVGNGMDEGVTIGPLIYPAALDKVEKHVADAKARGATVLLGGARHELGGSYFQPTVLRDVPADAMVSCEETFGPVAPLIKFETEEEVLKLANDTPFGLASYFFSQNINRIWRVSEALESGIVGINTGLISTEVAPFGGIKQSGIGREGSKYGTEEFVEIKYLCMGAASPQ